MSTRKAARRARARKDAIKSLGREVRIMSKPATSLRTAATLLFMFLATAAAADLKMLLEKYLNASNRHDLETLREMTAQDAVWKIGPELLVGREAVLTPNECDAGANTRLKWSNIVVRGNTVEFELVERNDILRALRIPEVRHFVRFTFENGLVKRKEESKPAIGTEALSATQARFLTWLRQTHPEALARLLTPEGKFIYSRDNCRFEATLAAEWAGSSSFLHATP